MASLDGNCEATIQYLTATDYTSCTVGEQDPSTAIAIQALFDGTYHRASSAIVPGRAIKFTTDSVQTGVAEGPSRVAAQRLALTPSANPFTGRVVLRYSLPTASNVHLSVYDATGRVVRNLVNTGAEQQRPGQYSVAWDGNDDYGRQLSAGIYFYRLESSAGKLSRKAVLTR
jgi:flagellar hook assembly protein FlgD